MYSAARLLVYTACLAFYLVSQLAFAQSPCAALKSTREFALCVDDAASFQCQNSTSFKALRGCFSRTARAIVGSRMAELEKWNGDPLTFDCTEWFLPGLYACSIHFLSGAPEEWCFRNDVSTVSWCEGDPPNHKCKKVACPLSSCNTSDVFSRCGMVWKPNLK
jgi:hypothetical protein